MINILIADDHQILLDGLKTMLQSVEEFEVVGQCTNGEQVLHLLASMKVDLLLLDINMPRMNGIEVTQEIKEKFPEVRVIALSMYKQPSYINKMLNAGAHGYLLKDDGKDVILEAIKAVFQGTQYLSKQVSDILSDVSKSKPINLGITTREKEVLNELANGHSSKEISKKLNISFHTVKTHRKHLMQKFGVNNVTNLLSKAKEFGVI